MLTPVRWGRFKRDLRRAEKRGKDMTQRLCRRIGFALHFLATMSLAEPAFSQSPVMQPCPESEALPGPGEHDPTIRKPTMTTSETASTRFFLPQACLVFGESQNNYLKGSYLNWGMALFGDNGGLLGVNGAAGHTPFRDAGHKTLGFSIANVGVALRKEQQPTQFIAQVDIQKCVSNSTHSADEQYRTDDCPEHFFHSPDPYEQGHYLSALLHPSPNPQSSSRPAAGKFQSPPNSVGTPCLAPIKNGVDPEVREIIVSRSGNYYHVVACLVSDQYASFEFARVEVRLWTGDCANGDGHCINAATEAANPPLYNIGPLIGRTGDIPQTVAIFAADLIPMTTVLPVRRADVTLRYIGCHRDNSVDCEKPKADHKITRDVQFVDIPQ